METTTILIGGQVFDKNSKFFSFEWPLRKLEDVSELKKLSHFPHLHTASFSSFQLPDLGLQYLCEATQLQNLNLQDTLLTNQGLCHLQKLQHLSHLRLKEHSQLNEEAVPFLNQLQNLTELQIHETSIYEKGLQQLNLPKLRQLLVNEVEKGILLELSNKLPYCSILVKGKMELWKGQILWER